MWAKNNLKNKLFFGTNKTRESEFRVGIAGGNEIVLVKNLVGKLVYFWSGSTNFIHQTAFPAHIFNKN